MTQNEPLFSPLDGSAVAGFLSPGCTDPGNGPYLMESERALQRILQQNPSVKSQIALLIHGYRELVKTSVEAMAQGETDSADICISLAKKDAVLEQLEIPLLDTQEDWMRVREQI